MRSAVLDKIIRAGEKRFLRKPTPEQKARAAAAREIRHQELGLVTFMNNNTTTEYIVGGDVFYTKFSRHKSDARSGPYPSASEYAVGDLDPEAAQTRFEALRGVLIDASLVISYAGDPKYVPAGNMDNMRAVVKELHQK